MKIFFQKEHSLYKIFKTLEKIPENKTIYIYLDPEHSFFENERRGKQIQEILAKRKINAFFITQNERSKKFFQNIGMQIIHQEQNKLVKIIKTGLMFFFNIKRFHLYIYNKKNVIFYVIFFFETVFILGILYLLYTLILPSVTIQIKSAYQMEPIIYNFRYYPQNEYNFEQKSRYLSIPYYTGEISYKYDMSISVSNIQHIQNPSKGQITVFNKTPEDISIVPNSRIITSNGLLFENQNWFTIPSGTQDKPGEITITVNAMEKDDKNMFIGSRGNLKEDTTLYFKNLKNSYYLKEIYAKTIEDFTGGSLNTEGFITQEDIELLSGKLVEYMQKNKQNIMNQNFNITNGILLGFNSLTSMEIQDIQIKNKVGEKFPNIQGYIISKIYFNYIQKDDLLNTVKKYLNQRPSEKVKLINLDGNSISFFADNLKIENQNIIIIPTKVNAIQGYDFNKDINNIINEIKEKVLNKSETEAKNIILKYPETAGVKIKITPFWYNQIPRLKSRIKIITE